MRGKEFEVVDGDQEMCNVVEPSHIESLTGMLKAPVGIFL
jgi:hypothetical protein